jgi:hypothetical protein
MTTIVEHHVRDERERTVEIVGVGSIAEALGAAAAIVLAILGLAGALPFYMMTIGTIVLGAAILFEGGAIASRYSKLLSETAEAGETRTASYELGGGMSAEALAGIAGLALGILALLGIVPLTLSAVAMILFGAGLLFGSAAITRLNSLTMETAYAGETTRRVVREAVSASAGGQVLIGIGAIVLGILALLGMDPLTLTLVALLGVGISVLFSGTALGARMLGIVRH